MWRREVTDNELAMLHTLALLDDLVAHTPVDMEFWRRPQLQVLL